MAPGNDERVQVGDGKSITHCVYKFILEYFLVVWFVAEMAFGHVFASRHSCMRLGDQGNGFEEMAFFGPVDNPP